ncbi:hypothetical protein BV20DRAFT_1112920 [Pilatotrama ljubarskyi]|nr:hypothetical protein BV20DRAFT_1112920 [Pilatotrama ljubarskyi]
MGGREGKRRRKRKKRDGRGQWREREEGGLGLYSLDATFSSLSLSPSARPQASLALRLHSPPVSVSAAHCSLIRTARPPSPVPTYPAKLHPGVQDTPAPLPVHRAGLPSTFPFALFYDVISLISAHNYVAPIDDFRVRTLVLQYLQLIIRANRLGDLLQLIVTTEHPNRTIQLCGPTDLHTVPPSARPSLRCLTPTYPTLDLSPLTSHLYTHLCIPIIPPLPRLRQPKPDSPPPSRRLAQSTTNPEAAPAAGGPAHQVPGARCQVPPIICISPHSAHSLAAPHEFKCPPSLPISHLRIRTSAPSAIRSVRFEFAVLRDRLHLRWPLDACHNAIAFGWRDWTRRKVPNPNTGTQYILYTVQTQYSALVLTTQCRYSVLEEHPQPHRAAPHHARSTPDHPAMPATRVRSSRPWPHCPNTPATEQRVTERASWDTCTASPSLDYVLSTSTSSRCSLPDQSRTRPRVPTVPIHGDAPRFRLHVLPGGGPRARARARKRERALQEAGSEVRVARRGVCPAAGPTCSPESMAVSPAGVRCGAWSRDSEGGGRPEVLTVSKTYVGGGLYLEARFARCANLLCRLSDSELSAQNSRAAVCLSSRALIPEAGKKCVDTRVAAGDGGKDGFEETRRRCASLKAYPAEYHDKLRTVRGDQAAAAAAVAAAVVQRVLLRSRRRVFRRKHARHLPVIVVAARRAKVREWRGSAFVAAGDGARTATAAAAAAAAEAAAVPPGILRSRRPRPHRRRDVGYPLSFSVRGDIAASRSVEGGKGSALRGVTGLGRRWAHGWCSRSNARAYGCTKFEVPRSGISRTVPAPPHDTGRIFRAPPRRRAFPRSIGRSPTWAGPSSTYTRLLTATGVTSSLREREAGRFGVERWEMGRWENGEGVLSAKREAQGLAYCVTPRVLVEHESLVAPAAGVISPTVAKPGSYRSFFNLGGRFAARPSCRGPHHHETDRRKSRRLPTSALQAPASPSRSSRPSPTWHVHLQRLKLTLDSVLTVHRISLSAFEGYGGPAERTRDEALRQACTLARSCSRATGMTAPAIDVSIASLSSQNAPPTAIRPLAGLGNPQHVDVVFDFSRSPVQESARPCSPSGTVTSADCVHRASQQLCASPAGDRTTDGPPHVLAGKGHRHLARPQSGTPTARGIVRSPHIQWPCSRNVRLREFSRVTSEEGPALTDVCTRVRRRGGPPQPTHLRAHSQGKCRLGATGLSGGSMRTAGAREGRSGDERGLGS